MDIGGIISSRRVRVSLIDINFRNDLKGCKKSPLAQCPLNKKLVQKYITIDQVQIMIHATDKPYAESIFSLSSASTLA